MKVLIIGLLLIGFFLFSIINIKHENIVELSNQPKIQTEYNETKDFVDFSKSSGNVVVDSISGFITGKYKGVV